MKFRWRMDIFAGIILVMFWVIITDDARIAHEGRLEFLEDRANTLYNMVIDKGNEQAEQIEIIRTQLG